MAKDAALHARLQEIASTSPQLVVERLTSGRLAIELGIDVGGSRNPFYRFRVKTPDGGEFEAVAFTLLLNGANRPATRAEALGQAIAVGQQALFDHNPFLLIFDYVGDRFMAVSAAELFGAFAEETASRSIPPADSASFSLTPSFERRTVTMYATVKAPSVWWCGDVRSLGPEELIRGLRQIRTETVAADVAKIVAAVEARRAGSALPIATATDQSGPSLSLGDKTEETQAGPDEQVIMPPEIGPEDVHLAEVRSLLYDDGYGGVILTGPPGTGKTWYARQIALSLTEGDTSRIREIQFHPSYQYEDFVEGYVPKGAGKFRMTDKHLIKMCERAEEVGKPVFLVIDEFSRSDPVRVMGEALTYMDSTARGRRFYLASGRPLVIPANLYFLATMNPEDRSVDEMDAAMERRWARVELKPEPSKVNDFLRENGMQRTLRGLIVGFFQSIQENSAIGHAYFRNVRDRSSLSRLWNRQLVHVIQKQHRYSPETVERLTSRFELLLAALDQAVQAPSDISVNAEPDAVEPPSAPPETADQPTPSN